MANAIIFLYLSASNVAFGTESHHLYKINDKILKEDIADIEILLEAWEKLMFS